MSYEVDHWERWARKNISAHKIDHLPIILNDIECKYNFVNTLNDNGVNRRLRKVIL